MASKEWHSERVVKCTPSAEATRRTRIGEAPVEFTDGVLDRPARSNPQATECRCVNPPPSTVAEAGKFANFCYEKQTVRKTDS